MSATMNTKKEFFSENTSPMLHPDYKLKIADIFRSNLSPKLKQDTLSDYHENDIAAALDLLSREERSRIYRILTPETLANILEYSEQMDTYLDEISLKQRVQILELLEVSAAADYLDQLEKSQRDVLLDLIDEDTRQELLMLSSFGEEAIGSKMSTNYIAFHSGTSICQAMSELVEQAAEHDNISTLYVVDETGTYLGAINLKELIIARKDTKLDAITMTSYPYVYANEPIEDCISRIVDYSEDSIPVLDSGNKLRGVLTSQDLTELVDQEMGDDYAKLAGLASEEDLNEPLVQSIKKRLPWLIILLGLGLLVSSVVGIFEGVDCQSSFNYRLPVSGVRHGRKCRHPVSGCHHPRINGRKHQQQTANPSYRKRGPRGTGKRNDFGTVILFVYRAVFSIIERPNCNFILFRIFLHRNCPAGCHAFIQPFRNYCSTYL